MFPFLLSNKVSVFHYSLEADMMSRYSYVFSSDYTLARGLIPHGSYFFVSYVLIVVMFLYACILVKNIFL